MMNEIELAEDVLNKALGIARYHQARHIRVINVGQYTESVDCSELTFHLKTLAQDTIAADALLNLNQRPTELRKSTPARPTGRTCAIESIELE